MNADFWKNKRVFLTGHTGFKGSWMSIWLHHLGAKVYGYSLAPNTEPSLFNSAKIESLLEASFFADIRDRSKLAEALKAANPDVVIHMAAQPLVRLSYENPFDTYEVNVMGTLNLLCELRQSSPTKATLIITSDKCYENFETGKLYDESDPLGGYDPYSSSKACTEILTASMQQSFFNPLNSGTTNFIATVRAGNVIGGGDWSADRLIPDIVRNWSKNKPVIIRNPLSIRPWQHVLEPIKGYLEIIERMYSEGAAWTGPWNFGPEEQDQKNVEYILAKMISSWGGDVKWIQDKSSQPHEAKLLQLNIQKVKSKLGWRPTWSLDHTIHQTAMWYKNYYLNPEKAYSLCLEQIKGFQNGSFQ